MKSVSILGCGWLGLPLAAFFVENGYIVRGSTTDNEKLLELKENSIEPYLINLNPNLTGKDFQQFFSSEVLIVNFPPQRRDDIVEYLKSQILSLKKEIIAYNIKKVVFISSTSVYPDVNRLVSEEDNLQPTKESGKALKQVESILLNSSEFNTTVLRFAGLIGYDRNPRNFLKKRRVLSKINSPVNLIHRDDCINIIFKIVKGEFWGEVFNACSDFHPNRKEFYQNEAKISGIEIDELNNFEEADYKLISNQKLKDKLNYSFKYPNPLEID